MFWCAICWTFAVVTRACIVLALLWLAKELTMGICLSKRRLDGKVAIVTGATAGIGFETALDLAKRGATVIITGRDLKKGALVEANIRLLSGNANVQLKRLDLSSQRDVKRFAAEIGGEFPKLHYLVNNAGMVGELDFLGVRTQRQDTEDGFEITMATNFFGQTTLTEMLLDNLKAAAIESKEPSRIISVSSFAHFSADLNLSEPDLNRRRSPYNTNMQYNNSKLVQIAYSNELARRLQGSNVESVSLHPGVVRTDIFRNTSEWWVRLYLGFMFGLMGKNAWQGAQTSIHAVVAEGSVNGMFLTDCAESWFVSKRLGNPEIEKKFYKEVKKLLGLR